MSTLVMSLGMIAFFAVVMTVAWHRYQRHTTKAAERSQANVVQLLMDSEVIAAQSRAVQGNPPQPSNVDSLALIHSPGTRVADAQAEPKGLDARDAREHR